MYNDIELLKIKNILENDSKINNIIKKYKIYKEVEYGIMI